MEINEIAMIGLDLGTSAVKGVALAPDGRIIACRTVTNPVFHPRSGLAEQLPEEHYLVITGIIRELAQAVDVKVAAIAMAAASGNTLLCDQEGNPLTNIVSWLDNRGIIEPPQLLEQFNQDEVYTVTGWPCISSFPLAHLAWFMENQPDIYNRTHWFCMNSDWLSFRLTGHRLIDYSTAASFHLLEQNSRQWHVPFLNRLGITPEQLSAPIASATPMGKLTAVAAADTGLTSDTMVISGCFDHPAAARASGILHDGNLLLSCGTSWVGFLPEKRREKILEAGLLCDPFLTDQGGGWGGIFSVPYIGNTIEWYVDNLIAPGSTQKYKIFDNLAAAAPVGANGLKIDLKKPPRMIKASPGDVARAVMENAALQLQEKLTELKDHGIEFDRAVIVGGPSRSPIWPRIISDATGLKLIIGDSYAGAKGAAMLAGIGIGIYSDEEDAWNKAGVKHEY